MSRLVSPRVAAAFRALIVKTLIQSATVYIVGAGGEHSVVDESGLACRLLVPNIRRAEAAGAERPELIGARELRWLQSYTPPSEYVQFEIGGERWQPVAGTFDLRLAPDGEAIYRRCAAVKAEA